MSNSNFLWIKVSKKDYPYISEAFATAVAFHANQTHRFNKNKEENWKKAEALAEIAGRVNAAEMKFDEEQK